MIVLKGDKVRTASGSIGEVIETWGRARNFLSLKLESNGKSIPIPETDVKEIIQRKQDTKRWGR